MAKKKQAPAPIVVAEGYPALAMQRVRSLVEQAAGQYLYAPRPALRAAVARKVASALGRACDDREGWAGRGPLVGSTLWAVQLAEQIAGILEPGDAGADLDGAFAALRDLRGAGAPDREGFLRLLGFGTQAERAGRPRGDVDLTRLLRSLCGGRPSIDLPELFYAAWRVESRLRERLEEVGRGIAQSWRGGAPAGAAVARLLRLLRAWWIPGDKDFHREKDGIRYGLFRTREGGLEALTMHRWIARAPAIDQVGPVVAVRPPAERANDAALRKAVGGDILAASLVDRFVFDGIIASPSALGYRTGDALMDEAKQRARQRAEGAVGRGLPSALLTTTNRIRGKLLARGHAVAAHYGIAPSTLDQALATASFSWNPSAGRRDHAYVWDHAAGTLDVDPDAAPRPLGLVLHGLMTPVEGEQERRWHELACEALGATPAGEVADRAAGLLRLGWVQADTPRRRRALAERLASVGRDEG